MEAEEEVYSSLLYLISRFLCWCLSNCLRPGLPILFDKNDKLFSLRRLLQITILHLYPIIFALCHAIIFMANIEYVLIKISKIMPVINELYIYIYIYTWICRIACQWVRCVCRVGKVRMYQLTEIFLCHLSKQKKERKKERKKRKVNKLQRKKNEKSYITVVLHCCIVVRKRYTVKQS